MYYSNGEYVECCSRFEKRIDGSICEEYKGD